MKALRPDKLWWTAREIAEASLPDLATTRQNVEALAKREHWRADPHRARTRKGRGGGWEYSWELFPARARAFLLKGVEVAETPAEPDRAALHRQFDGLPQKAKDKARRQLKVLQAVTALEELGQTKFLAVEMVASQEGVSSRTIWNWFNKCDGHLPSDWLYCLAPRHRTATRKLNKAFCDKAFMDWLKADYLRLDGGSFAASYGRAVEICKADGHNVLAERTARRRLNEEVPRATQVYAREGLTGLMKCYPPQIRDRSGLVAMEAVNADCHKLDVFVNWPLINKPVRVHIIAFQDLYSGKILSWRIDHNPNKVMVMAAFGEMVEEWGIPQHCTFDNGHEFANKWLTGGAETRFRFKIRDDDPLGVLEQLNIKIHWATPAHGQAKPIERGFRDMADHIARDPRFAGAYVGNRPDAKPENYGERAIDLDRFVAVVGEGIQRHNAQVGRKADTCNGRSFDETFAESYSSAAIVKATEEQRRMWLLGQEVRKLHQHHGSVTFAKNVYNAPWMVEFAGQKVVIRFEPEDLHAGVYVYSIDGEFMGYAACQQKVGFYDLTEARQHAKAKRDFAKAQKAALEAHQVLRVTDVANAMDRISPVMSDTPEAKVVRMADPARKPKAAKVSRPEHVEKPDAQRDAELLDFQRRHDARAAVKTPAKSETPSARYDRALALQARIDADKPIGEAEANWLAAYRHTAEFSNEARMRRDFQGFLK